MAKTTLSAALSNSATSITVPVDEALALFPAPQFGAWIGTEQVQVVSGPPASGTWSILRDQSAGGGALFSDTFDRDEDAGWGNGWGRGQPLESIVSGGLGLIVPDIAGGGKQLYQSSLTVLDAEVRFRFWGDLGATGDEFNAYAIFRDDGATIGTANYYRMACSVRASDQLMRLRGEGGLAGVKTNLGGVPTTTGFTFAVDTVYWLAARCSGVSPTTLEAKVWIDGTDEPAAWTRTDTDSTLGPQVAGYPGLRGSMGGAWTGGALTLSFDDYSVLRIPVGTAWASGTAVQSIDEVDPLSLIDVGAGPPISQPPDGARYVDRTNNRLYVRANGVWRYTVLT